MIQVLLPCCKADESQAMALLSWIAQMGQVDAPLFILCDSGCQVKHLVSLGEKAFTKVQWLADYENILSDWNAQGNQPKSAAGPNSLFRQAIWHFANTKDPWLFLEPDAIPCRPDWLILLDKEYHARQKPFMGFLVSRETHPGVTAQHMSGVAIYPANSPEYFGRTILASNTAFDIATASSVLERMHNTSLIFHRYRPPTFADQEDFEGRVSKDLAIYHACKDGSIYPFLRNRLSLSAPQPVGEVHLAEPLPSKQTVAGSIPVTRSISKKEEAIINDLASAAFESELKPCDIFIKTREHDYPWLKWCLKSIQKFATGFRTVITKSETVPPVMMGSVVHAKDHQPGYLWQQACKLTADHHSDAEYILFQDSDTIFTRPISPSDFIKDGKPVWLYTPLDQARPDQHVWAPVMEKFLGKKPEHEFMRRHPFIVQRWMLEAIRTFCLYKHGKTLEAYIMGEADPNNGLALRFSEWNCLGFFLWEYHRDKVEWVLDSEAGPACVYQGFTHGGEQRKQEDLAKFKELLEGNPEEGDIASEVVPSEEKTESVAGKHDLTVPSAIAFLAASVKNNIEKARIIKQIKKAWAGKGEPRKAKYPKKDEWLLCIHSYPGANETVERHWDNFLLSGATRIAGIGTLDGGCAWPEGCDAITLGRNAYLKFKGEDDNLCRRLMDTVRWCLTQREDKFVICEYDVLFLKKFPPFNGVSACRTGGRVNGSKASQFFHGPWCFDRNSAAKLLTALADVLPESQSYPNNSPDLFFGLACERAKIAVNCNFTMFTRNTLDHDLELACEAARNGVDVIHGCKTKEHFEAIMNATRPVVSQ